MRNRLLKIEVQMHLPDAIKGEENSSFIFLRKLHPHSDSQAFRGTSEKWNNLRSAASSRIAKVQVVIHLNGCKNLN